MKKLVCLILMFTVFSAYAQTLRTVKGTVSDEEGVGLIGVNVYLSGNEKYGVITDFEGKYEIAIPKNTNNKLVFSFIGMKTVKKSVGKNSVLDVIMTEDVIMMDEIVAIGYGNVRKSDLTGSVATVQSKDIKDMPVTNLMDALKGRIPGVVFSTSDGSQEASMQVRVRGGISVTQDNSPLYIVDGLPMNDALNLLDPNDIERIDVLKDAVSTAIYGSQGANGVVVITTKQGQKGKAKISYDTYWSFKSLSKKIEMLKPYEYALYSYEQLGGSNGIGGWEKLFGPYSDLEENFINRKGIDWQEEIFGGKKAVSQQHKVTITGGNDKSRYNVSYTYNNDGNMIPQSGQKMHSFRSKLDSKISQRLSITTNISYQQRELQGVGAYSENGRYMMKLLNYTPTNGMLGPDEDLLTNDNFVIDEEDDDEIRLNPYVQLFTTDKKMKNTNLNINMAAQYMILKNLNYNIQFGYTKNMKENRMFYLEGSSQARLENGPYGDIQQYNNEQLVGNHTLTYSRKNKKMGFDIMLGQELKREISSSLGCGAKGFPDSNFGLDYLGLGTVPFMPSSNKEAASSASFFGRVNYRLLDKYLFTATLRADGSSKFGADNRWGYFPAFAFAWRASEEKFIKNLKVFDNLKLRISYGVSGNNRISNYLSMSTYSPGWIPVEDNVVTVITPNKLENPDLKWENNATLNLGLDMGFLKNRISMTVDAYKVNTSNLLLNSNIPYVNGFGTCMRNIGQTESKGLEIGFASYNIQNNDFQWVTNFNISFNRTKVKKLADSNRWEIQSNSGGMDGVDYIIEVGRPIGIMWGYISDGLYQADEFNFSDGKWTLKDEIVHSNVFQNIQPGSKKYRNLNPSDDNITDENDKTIIGDANPLFTGGIMNSFSYKNFDLSLFCEFKVGGDIYNANLYEYLRGGKTRNTLKSVWDKRYRITDENGTFLLETGDVESLMRINQGKTLPYDGYIPFDSSMVEDGSYLRFTNLTLGYSFPKQWLEKIKVDKLRIYGTIYNLGVITGYSGYDPEVSMNRNNGLTPGIDRGSMPRSRNLVVGANIVF